MTKPIYDIDAPDQQKLKVVRLKIVALLKRHDLAGVVLLHTPGMAEFFYNIRPSYSVLHIDENPPAMYIRSKLDLDHGGNLQHQLHDQSATANMVASIAENLAHAALMFLDMQKVVDQAVRAEHTEQAFVPDPREAKPS